MMNLHLAANSADVASGKHAVLLLDQGGWHLSHKLAVLHNITVVFAAAEVSRVEPTGEHLGVYAGQLVVQPPVRQPQCSDRPLLQCLE